MLRHISLRAGLARSFRYQPLSKTRTFISSSAVTYPRSVSSIVLSPSPGGPPGDNEDGHTNSVPFFQKAARRARPPKGARGGGPDETSATPPPPKQPPLPESFAEDYVSSPMAPEEVSSQIQALRNVLLASFAPCIQRGNADPTVALVCPLEGGEYVVREALDKAAGLLSADVVRIDAIEALGMRQYGLLGEAGSCLALTANPLVTDSARPSNAEEAVDEDDAGEIEDEGDYEQMQEGQPVEFHIPIPAAFALPGGRGMRGPFGARGAPRDRAGDEDMARVDQLFKDIVNIEEKAVPSEQPSSSQRRRIIYVQDASAMASTFDQWFPSLCAAVKARRSPHDTSGETLQPTTIVLGCNPSLLHVGPNIRQEQAKAADAMAAQGQGGPMGPGTTVGPAVLRLLSNASSIFGGPLGADGQRWNQDGLWMSSAEDDVTGRRVRLGKRLKALNGAFEDDIRTLLPPFSGESSKAGASSSLPDPIKALMNKMGAVEVTDLSGGNNPSQAKEVKSGIHIWKVVGVLPGKRTPSREAKERMDRRLSINTLRLRKALGQSSAKLTESLPADELNEDENQSGRAISDISGELSSLRQSFSTSVWFWRYIQHFATMALGHSLSQASDPSSDTPITWKLIAEAAILDARKAEEHLQWTNANYKKAAALGNGDSASQRGHASSGSEVQAVDPVVEAVKKDRTLSAYEKRLLGCIVDVNKLSATTFDDVLLPGKTIDAVRTVVSLPLLYPEAFHSGVLAQHSTSGCLLFGPPGTGKTLLVRALAKESGARMLAVQPSDVSDMYVGEGEKLVKAVFSLARRLGPCIVFLDEVDSLFGARSGRGSGAGGQAHRQVLTEFMQEMDGLSSAVANREKQIIVMGATNRPYDLDDAVLRRLPRRLLVDLPGVAERLAILKIHLKNERLGPDVDLDKIARDTDTYSGSDLKHLCVSAALAAIKESVNIPWKAKAQQIQEQAGKGESDSGSQQAEAITLVHPDEDLAMKKPLEPVTETLSAQLIDNSPTLKAEVDAATTVAEDEDQPVPSDATINESLISAQMDVLNQARLSEEHLSSSTPPPGQARSSAASSENDTPPLPPRVIKATHFAIAMKEITPSSSEDGNLPELRKWAEQYGEGGTKRGKKAGYGSKFGFGDTQDHQKDAGYGRVRPEDNEK